MLEEAAQYVKFLQLQIKVRTHVFYWIILNYILEEPLVRVFVFINCVVLQLLSSDDMWMYAPIAYNGMNLGLGFDIKISPNAEG